MRRPRESGAVLVSALAIIALMTAAGMTILDKIHFSIRLAARQDEAEQARLHALGATDMVIARLEGQTFDTAFSDDMDALHRGEEMTLPVDQGRIAVRLYDGANCFNLNAILAGPPVRSTIDAGMMFRALLHALGVGTRRAVRLYEALSAAPGLLADMSEMARIDGFDADIAARIGDLVCLRPDRQIRPLNLNTLEVERSVLLAAYLGSGSADDLDSARATIAARPVGGFARMEDVFGGTRASNAFFSLSSGLYDISVEVRYLDARIRLHSSVEAGENQTMRIVSQRFGW